MEGPLSRVGSPSTGGRAGDPHQRVEVRDPAHHQVGEWGDPSLVEQCDHQVQEMGLCSSEMEMKSTISIIINTGFRPL